VVAMGARVSAVGPEEAERLKSQLQDLWNFSQTVVFDRHILASLSHVFWGYLDTFGHRQQEGCTLEAQTIWEAEVMVFCTSDTDNFGVDLKRHCGKYVKFC
jgi:hypothetical protein